ncbi:MAG: hypothetical protein RBR59_08890 [Sulfurimonadaceae bacterium]|jgi:serine/threonine protein kinase|nr:hypothetical protein [Sulfurimonadaceae bacterium]
MNYKVNKGFEKFTPLLQSIQTNFDLVDETIHKARNELKVLNYGNTEVVVKSFKIPHAINRIVYTFFKSSKAKKSYEYALRIGDFTPKPIGYIEFFTFGLLEKSYFIAEKFAYDFTIREPLLDPGFEDKEEVFKAFARFTLLLHQNNIFHNDYSPGNILIKKENGNYLFKIVDINRMKFVPLSQEQRAKSFSKLWAHDHILEIIATEYAKHHQVDADFTKQVLYFSNKNKKIKNFKKRLKGIEVND